MTATTVKSESITNLEAVPRVISDHRTGQLKIIMDKIALAATSLDEVDDLILACPIPSTAVILDIQVLNDDLDSDAAPTLAVDVGLAYSGISGNQRKSAITSGQAVDVNCFASAATVLQEANTAWQSVRFEADDIVNMGKPAWEVGGLSEDPGGILYVSLKVTTEAATAAAGDLVVRVDYI